MAKKTTVVEPVLAWGMICDEALTGYSDPDHSVASGDAAMVARLTECKL